MFSKWWKPGKYERIKDELKEVVSLMMGLVSPKRRKTLNSSRPTSFGRFNIKVKLKSSLRKHSFLTVDKPNLLWITMLTL